MEHTPSTILLVDDNADNRNVLSRRLERHGYAVETAASGSEALRMLERKHVDLVLLDIMMRDMDGLETLRRIRNRFSMLQLPVIMVTALAQSENAVEALQLGANDYVTKPVDFMVALARIRTHLVLQRLADQNDEFLRLASSDLKRALIRIQTSADELRRQTTDERMPVAALQTRMMQIADTAEMAEARLERFLQERGAENSRLREQVNLNELTRTVVSRRLVHAKRKGISIDVELNERELPVRMCEPSLELVVEHLLDNAIKFSPKGSTTRVRTRLDGSWAVVEVSDEGPGIPAPEQERIFDKYSPPVNLPTGGEAGAGVGLSVCKQYVEQYRGEIGVRNNDDHQGATFWCRLRAD